MAGRRKPKIYNPLSAESRISKFNQYQFPQIDTTNSYIDYLKKAKMISPKAIEFSNFLPGN
jgi:hypothetical protein